MPIILWHSTTAESAQAILRDGFRDGTGSYMFATIELSGVWVSNVPLDENEGAISGALLRITLADANAIDEYEIVEDEKPYREWCIPAAYLVANATIELLTAEEEEVAREQGRVLEGEAAGVPANSGSADVQGHPRPATPEGDEGAVASRGLTQKPRRTKGK